MKIAFHKVKITPQEPSYICGHAMRVHLHEGVLDDLFISLLRLQSGNETYLFGSIDLVGLDQELVDQMKAAAQSYGIPKEHVILSVIHTHAGPEYMDVNVFSKDPETGARPGYRAFLLKAFEEAVQGCDDFREVNAAYASVMIDGYYGNRNDKTYPCDKSANFILFKEGDTPIYMIGNLTCHPTILGPQNYQLSADLFGAVRDRLSSCYHVPVFMMNGAQGDVSNRQYRQGNDETELKRVADGICAQLQELPFTDIAIEPMSIKDITYVVDYVTDPARIEDEIARAKQILETATDPDVVKVTKSGLAFMELNKTLDPHVHEEITTRIVRMGELTIVTVGAELFTKFALQIKAAFPDNKLFIWGITDASAGYLVEQEEYGKTYESMTTRIPKGEVERYVDDIIAKLKEVLK